ncbi:MAG TPA: kinase [Deltaproteobacteria bacterium]|nr:kinase [Deltaproteobacteria bacterium]
MSRGEHQRPSRSFRIAHLMGREVTPLHADCVASLDPTAPSDYRELAALLASDWRERRPAHVGLGGGQGAGKSTLARLIESACSFLGTRVCVLGLDDFYLPLSERRRLAAEVHPLLETRGPPGTHDIEACREAMESLHHDVETRLPIFDKGLDDRSGFRRVRGPFDLVLLEGWCVGARPAREDRLVEPINALERDRDPDGVWRRYVNGQLAGSYARVWERLDWLAFLRVPDLAAIRRWRFQQEAARPVANRLSPEDVESFVAFFERISLDMLGPLPPRADLEIDLAADHSIAALRVPKESPPVDRGQTRE